MSAQFKNLEETLESAIDIQLAEELLAARKNQVQWNACKDFFAPILNAFQKLGGEPRFNYGAMFLAVTGDKTKLAQFFRVFRHAGFNFTADRPKQGDTTWSAGFRHPEQSVHIHFTFSSSVCRRVKVGTKMVETDIFETQCGDLVLPEAVPPLIAEADAAPTTSSLPSADTQWDDEVPF